MPSLHAGAALLVALFLWPSVSRVVRAALVAYAVAMALTLVYTGEHYVVDILAGWAVAALGGPRRHYRSPGWVPSQERARPAPRRGARDDRAVPPHRGDAGSVARGLVGAAHAGPALAVTVLAGLLAVAQDLSAGRAALVVAAVLAGQLSVGWSNDLIDLRPRPRGRALRQAAGDGRGPGVARACVLRRRRRLLRGAVAGLRRRSPGWCTWSAWRRPGPTTSGSSRPCGRGCRTPSPSGC